MVLLAQGTGLKLSFVPSNAVPVTSIAISKPQMINPTIVTTLIAVNQYSISPYRRTLRMLNKTGKAKNIVIHSALGLSLQ
jgi:hypothetical protein